MTLFLTTKWVPGWDEGPTNDVMTAYLIGLSAKLYDFEYPQSHLAFLLLSTIYISGPLYTNLWPVMRSHSRNPRYFRNAAQSGLSESEDARVSDIWDTASGVVVVKAESSHRWVTWLMLHCL